MATVDSLEVKISADAEKASQSLDKLVKKLDSVAKSLGSINASAMSSAVNELTGKLYAINGKGFNELNKSAKEAETTMKKVSDTAKKGIKSKISFDTKDYLGVIDNLNKKFANAGKGFKVGDTLVQMQKQSNALNKEYDRLKQKEDKIISVGKMNPENSVFHNLQYDINAVLNNLDTLYSKMGQLPQKTKEISNINIHGWNENQNVSDVLKQPRTVKIPASSMGYNKEAVAGVEAIYQKMYGDAEKAGQKTDSLGNKVETLKAKLKELSGQGLNFGDKEFDETYKKLNRASEELKKHKNNLDQAGNSGKTFSERMKNALANASSQTNKTSGSMGKLASSVKNALRSVKQSSDGFGGFAKKIGVLYAKIYVLRRGFNALSGTVKLSMDYIENLNYFNAAFGQVAKKADLKSFKEMGYNSAEAYYNSFSQRAEQLTQKMSGFKIEESGMAVSTGKKSMGIDPSLLMNYQAMFAQMSSSMGIASETAEKLSSVFTRLGADLASLKNEKFEKVWQNMASGMTGMSRAVDKYGMNIREANLQQTLANIGIDKSISKLTQQEKVLLRTIVMVDSSRAAWGDLAKTMNQPANQLRLLQSNWSNLSRTIGNIFLPIVAKVLPYINAVTIMLQRFAEQIVKLLGFKDFDWGGIGATGGADIDLDFGDAEDSTAGMADNMDKTSKKAKKAVDNIQGFDILNKLQEPDKDKDKDKDSGKGLSPSETAKLGGALGKLLDEYDKAWNKAFKDMENKANTIATKMQKALGKIVKAAQPTINAIKKLWNEGLSKLMKFKFDNLMNFWNNFLKPIGKWFLGDDSGLPRFFEITNDLLNEIDWDRLEESLANFYTAIQKPTKFVWTALMDFYEEFLKPIAVWTFSDAIPKLTDALTGLIDGIDWEGANSTFKSLFGFLSSVLVSLGNTVVNIASNILPKLSPVINNTMSILKTLLDNVLKPIWNFVSANLLPIIENVASTLAGAYLSAASSVLEIMGNFADKLSQNVNPALSYLSETVLPNIKSGFEILSGILSPIVDVFSNILANAINEYVNPALSFLADEVLPKVGETFKNLWENVLVPFGEFLSSVLKPVVEIVADVFSALWKNVVKPLADAVGNVLSKAFNGLYSVLNSTIIPVFKVVIDVGKKIWNNVLSPLVKNVKDVLKPVFETAFGAIKGSIGGISKTLGGVIDFITGVFSGDWKKAWKGVKDIFSGVWKTLSSVVKTPINGVLSLFEGLANKIIDAWNWVKKQLNKVSIDIPDWVPGAGGKKFGFDLKMSSHTTLPRFATGGFPEEGPFYMNRGEIAGKFSNGKSVVANNQQITDGIAQAVAPAVYSAVKSAINEQGSGAGQIVINLDGRKIAESTIDQVNAMTRQRGTNPILRYT